MSSLELELSAKLFDRVGRRIFLTEAGDVLLPYARQISAETEHVKDVFNNLGHGICGKLSIGTSPHIEVRHLAPVLKHLHNSYPGIRLDLRFDSSINTISAVETGLFEIALCPMHGAAPDGLQEIEIWTENLLIVVAPGHPLAASQNIGVTDQ